MKPASYTLNVVRGDDVKITIRARTNTYDPATQTYTLGDYIDLTGYTVASMFRLTPDATSPTPVTATCNVDANQVLNKGTFYVVLSETQSAQIADGWGFDIELVNPSGFKQTYITGKVVLTLDYTHV